MILRKNQAIIFKKLKDIKGCEFSEFISSIEKYENMLKDLYSCSYPIKYVLLKKFRKENIDKLISLLELTNEKGSAIIPYFDRTDCWIKLKIDNYNEFLNSVALSNYFESITIIDLNRHKIYDIELGECDYEIRIKEF